MAKFLIIFGVGSFYLDTPSEQYGVYVDFFDSVGIRMYIEPVSNSFMAFVKLWSNDFKTRPQARIEAIKKANKIYNDGIKR